MRITYGYARCSTNETLQDIDRQKRELRKLGVEKNEHIYCEYESGTSQTRPELNELLNIVCQGGYHRNYRGFQTYKINITSL